jgi:long-chain acyl-CoA synthetase
MQFTPSTLQQMLQHSVKEYGERTCFSYVDGKATTYAELGSKVEEVQRLLLAHAIQPGDKVAILSQNMPTWGIAYLAIVSMGAVVVPLLPDFSPVEIENVLNHSDAKALFVSERLRSKLNAICTPGIETCLSIETPGVTNTRVKAGSATLDNSYMVKPGDLASIIYTSGTTGKSKGVMLTHHNLCAQLEMIYKLQQVEKEDVFLSLLPLSHTFENSLGLLTPVYRGAAVYYLDKAPTPSVLLPAVAKIRPTYMLTVPMIIEKVFKSKVLPQLTATKLTRTLYSIPAMRRLMHRKAAGVLYKTFGGNLKFFGIGGAKLDATVERFLYEGKVFPYAIGYGLTETAPLIAGANPGMVKRGSTGPAVEGVTMRINEPNRYGIGEVWVKGANVMQGYYKEQSLTSEVFSTDGFFKTGDLGKFDSRGHLHIKGRLKNMILGAGGENIYPEDIESVISNFRYVADSLVVEQKGRLVAMVRFNHDELEAKVREMRVEAEHYIEQLKAELQAYVNSQVSRFSQISTVVALPSDFEKTSTLKIKRYLYATK